MDFEPFSFYKKYFSIFKIELLVIDNYFYCFKPKIVNVKRKKQKFQYTV